jgi:hypothetical protein
MDTGKAIFFGLALIALALFARDGFRPATAALGEAGRYIGGGAAGNIAIWVVDTETGAVRLCKSGAQNNKCDAWLK